MKIFLGALFLSLIATVSALPAPGEIIPADEGAGAFFSVHTWTFNTPSDESSYKLWQDPKFQLPKFLCQKPAIQGTTQKLEYAYTRTTGWKDEKLTIFGQAFNTYLVWIVNFQFYIKATETAEYTFTLKGAQDEFTGVWTGPTAIEGFTLDNANVKNSWDAPKYTEDKVFKLKIDAGSVIPVRVVSANAAGPGSAKVLLTAYNPDTKQTTECVGPNAAQTNNIAPALPLIAKDGAGKPVPRFPHIPEVLPENEGASGY